MLAYQGGPSFVNTLNISVVQGTVNAANAEL